MALVGYDCAGFPLLIKTGQNDIVIVNLIPLNERLDLLPCVG